MVIVVRYLTLRWHYIEPTRLDAVRRAVVARELGLEPLGEHALDLSR